MEYVRRLFRLFFGNASKFNKAQDEELAKLLKAQASSRSAYVKGTKASMEAKAKAIAVIADLILTDEATLKELEDR